jgi:hypothetical protein
VYEQLTKSRRNKSAVVIENVLRSIEVLKKHGTKPAFNSILTYLSSRRILSNHRSLRAYLDIMVKSGLLSLRKETIKQPNVPPRQVYSITSRGPLVEVGDRAMLFYGLNWTIPSRSSIQVKTDIEGLARGQVGKTTMYGSLEDTIVEMLSRNKNTERLYRTLTFCAAMLATKKFDQSYLIQRAKQRHVEDLVEGLLEEIDYLLNTSRPEVDDIRTLYAIRKRLVNFPRTSFRLKSRTYPLSLDETIDIIGKQVGVK